MKWNFPSLNIDACSAVFSSLLFYIQAPIVLFLSFKRNQMLERRLFLDWLYKWSSQAYPYKTAAGKWQSRVVLSLQKQQRECWPGRHGTLGEQERSCHCAWGSRLRSSAVWEPLPIIHMRESIPWCHLLLCIATISPTVEAASPVIVPKW